MTDSTDLRSYLGASARVVLIAPHPDDESLAAGGLIQRAIGAGARVTIVVMTDGESNPWPQRVADGRMFIGAAERAAWGRRRREEVRAAAAVLGVPPDSVRHAGMPDLGLTAALMRDPVASTEPLVSIFIETAPTLVIAPSIDDRHPDHSASYVLCQLALARAGSNAHVGTYVVHGAASLRATALELAPAARERKLRAVAKHRSQLILSRARMLGYAARPERFELRATSHRREAGSSLVQPWRVGSLGARTMNLLVVSGDRAWTVGIGRSRADDWRAPVCQRDSDGRITLHPAQSGEVEGPLYVKLVSRLPSPWIYDRWGWAEFQR